MSGRRFSSVLAILAALFISAPAFAQPAPSASPGPRLEVTVGSAFALSAKVRTTDAVEKAPDGSALTLFKLSGTESGKAGIDLTIGIRLTGRLWAEASGSIAKPEFRTSISGDFEGAPGATLTLPMKRYSVEGAAVWMLRKAGRFQPFVRGGAGWMREISADSVLVQDNMLAVAGGGIKYWLRQRDTGHFRRFGLRFDARVIDRLGDLSLGVGRISGSLFGGAIIGF
jgi:hypothetical protein